MPTRFSEILRQHQAEILDEWVAQQIAAATMRRDLLTEPQLREQSRRFLSALQAVVQDGGFADLGGPRWADAREVLARLSRERAEQGFSPSETATFVFSLKKPLGRWFRQELAGASDGGADDFWSLTELLDSLGLYTIEVYSKSREEMIRRQQQDMLELSTPVISLFEGILAIPLIGTLDSVRAQVVMESLLQRIVDTGATIAIIDITGVPAVDTLVAQHLLKTVAAARLMGADCIISGIRPQIAQTIVHLGVDLNHVTTRSSLADALGVALRRNGVVLKKLDSDEAN